MEFDLAAGFKKKISNDTRKNRLAFLFIATFIYINIAINVMIRLARSRKRLKHPLLIIKSAMVTQSIQTAICPYQHYIYIYIYIYLYLYTNIY